MAVLPAGILGSIRGSLGGGTIIQFPGSGIYWRPRSYRDAASPAQLEMRRRFLLTTRIGVRLYRSHIYPPYLNKNSEYTALDFMRSRTMSPWYEEYGVPFVSWWPDTTRIERFWPFYNTFYPTQLWVRWEDSGLDYLEPDDRVSFVVIQNNPLRVVYTLFDHLWSEGMFEYPWSFMTPRKGSMWILVVYRYNNPNYPAIMFVNFAHSGLWEV